MITLADFNNIKLSSSWVTVGSFDGVHLGHQQIIQQLVESAHKNQEKAVVITFTPLPATFFGKAPQDYLLTSVEERESLLKSYGVDEVFALQFDEKIANLPARDFMRLLKDSLGLTHLFIGFNFALGKGRGGDFSSLQQIGNEFGYSVEMIQAFEIDHQTISSSQIRKLLQDGEIAKANRFLGRPYSLEGIVVHGEHRGNQLGFPTANMQVPPDRLLPARGVYASQTTVAGASYLAVTNIGIRPTFSGGKTLATVEPHLLGFSGDLYGHSLRLELLDYLRPESSFPSIDDLIAQINQDITRTKELYGQ